MRIFESIRLFLLIMLVLGTFFQISCDAPSRSSMNAAPTSQRYTAMLPEGGKLTIWVMRTIGPAGEPSVHVLLDDPLEPGLLNGTSQASKTDPMHVVFLLQDGGTNILKGLLPDEGSARASYTRKGSPAAMEIDLVPEKEDIVFTPRLIEKHIEPTKDPENSEGGGYEELGVAELGQDISLNLFTITRADRTRHPLDPVLERFICGKAGNYEAMVEGMKDGPISYELGTVINYRDTARVCLSVTIHEQWPGAAHGMFGTRILNYDLRNDREIGLWDVVDPKNRGALIAAASKSLYTLYPEKDKREWPFKLTENVMILRDGITFVHAPYEMGPFVEGEVSYHLPFRALRTMLRTSDLPLVK